jgi:hypothetical protein
LSTIASVGNFNGSIRFPFLFPLATMMACCFHLCDLRAKKRRELKDVTVDCALKCKLTGEKKRT